MCILLFNPSMIVQTLLKDPWHFLKNELPNGRLNRTNNGKSLVHFRPELVGIGTATPSVILTLDQNEDAEGRNAREGHSPHVRLQIRRPPLPDLQNQRAPLLALLGVERAARALPSQLARQRVPAGAPWPLLGRRAAG